MRYHNSFETENKYACDEKGFFDSSELEELRLIFLAFEYGLEQWYQDQFKLHSIFTCNFIK